MEQIMSLKILSEKMEGSAEARVVRPFRLN
jgi:hypothetical protein